MEFYETELFLVDTVCNFLLPCLSSGDAAIVVATATHRQAFEAGLADAGIDMVAATRESRYIACDAADLLSRFVVDGTPAASRFRQAIEPVLDRAAKGGRRLRVYGEMVAVLWEQGQEASALALEDLWNDLSTDRAFALLCAYPMCAFQDEASAAAFRQICEQHSTVIPSEGYSLLTDPEERTRIVAQLQQQTAAMSAELDRLRTRLRVVDPPAGPDRPDDGAPAAGDDIGVQRDEVGRQRDRAGAQRDQAGTRRDQAGTRRDQAGAQRDQAGVQRVRAGAQGDDAAERRDHAADRRDHAADRRDQAAERRDHAAERAEAAASLGFTQHALTRSAAARQEAASDRRRASQDRHAGIDQRAAAQLDRETARTGRRAGASERTEAELDRDTALADRRAGASERTEAELDRDTALVNRGASAHERASSSFDDLTGAYQRAAGFAELTRELDRTRRMKQPLVLAFVDVDGLKRINDSRGHAAGDRMLVEVASTFKAALRSHDLIIRYGGDEFICAISGLDLPDAATRIAHISDILAAAPEHGSVTVGLASLLPEDAVEDLVARADAALYRARDQQRHAPPVDAGRPA